VIFCCGPEINKRHEREHNVAAQKQEFIADIASGDFHDELIIAE
jgi:hypothetical protein